MAIPEEIVPRHRCGEDAGAAALNVLASSLLFDNRQVIIELASPRCVCPPCINGRRWREQGGLLAYGPRVVQVFGEAVARQIVELFRGAKPADVPVEQPSNFELVINS